MTSRWTSAAFTTSIAMIAACHAAAPSPPSLPSPSPPSLPSPSPSSLPSPSPSSAPVAPSPDAKCNPAAPAPRPNPAFTPLALRFSQHPDGTTTVDPELARRFPAISDDGRTIAILDERDTIEAGASLHLALLDVRTRKLALFTLWAHSAPANRRREAQRALDQARWQSLTPADSDAEDCGPPGALAPVPARPALPALRFGAVEFQFVAFQPVGKAREVELLRRTSSGEAKVALVPRGLPGTLGTAAVPTGDVGASCGLWDHLETGWVSQDGRTYLFKLGAHLGGRCGPAPTPVEYGSWVSP